MTTPTGRCAAPPTSCGTAYGWRQRGRCPRCRTAHNEETNRYRGITAEQRATVLALLRTGRNAKEAAAAIGRTPRSLSARAVRDGELRAALDGSSVAEQVVAHLGDYLAALTRTGGNRSAAARQTGMTLSTIDKAAVTHPHFGAAEKALREWITQSQSGIRLRIRIHDITLDKAAELIEQGGSVNAAASALGVTGHGLRRAAPRSERLVAALELRRGKVGSCSGLTPENAERLRAAWGKPDLNILRLAKDMGVSRATLYGWAKQLNLDLPDRHRSPGTTS